MVENIIQINSSGGGPYIVTHNSPSSGYVTVVDTASGNSIVIDVSSVSGGGGGAATSITFSPTGNIASTNVQTAIAELDSETLHLSGAETISGVKTFSSQPSGITAASIINTATGNISATTVQAAINELDTEKLTANANITAGTFTKITYDVKGLVTAGANATATDITNTPAGNISAVTVQAAINELDTEKVSGNAAITGATFTKVTYDSKGLITAGVDATAADIVNTPAGNIAAVTVQAALNELDSEKVSTSTFVTAGDTLRATGAGTYVRVRNNYSAAVNPSTTDDSSTGFLIGSRWINTTSDTEYVCVDNTASGAIWQQTSNLLSQMRYLAMIY